jgi:CDP-diacylglycerol--glycerol-3-phosphate 3-phosphatidyltransferase
MIYFSHLNTPLQLTLIRLIISPLVLPGLIVALLPYGVWWINVALALFFLLISATDFFDGYLARKFRQETLLGKMLDPIADKFLIYATLIGLLAVQKIYFYWVVLLIGRELFVMGLRQVAAQYRMTLHVLFLAKVKTVLEVLLLALLIAMPCQPYPGLLWWRIGTYLLLLVTIYLALYTAWCYYRQCIIGLDIHTRE